MPSVIKGSSNFDSDQELMVSRYLSPPQTIASGGLITLTHELVDKNGNPAEPFGVDFYIECVSAEHGYSIGDKLRVALNSTTGSGSRVSSIGWDVANIYFYLSTDTTVFIAPNKTTRAPAALSNANWELYIRAWV